MSVVRVHLVLPAHFVREMLIENRIKYKETKQIVVKELISDIREIDFEKNLLLIFKE